MAKQIVSGPARRALRSRPRPANRTQDPGSRLSELREYALNAELAQTPYESEKDGNREFRGAPAVLRQNLCCLLPKRRINPLAQFGGGNLQV